jgi:flagellar motor switch protein FliN
MSTAAAPSLAPELQNYARAWAKAMASGLPLFPGASCEMLSEAPAGVPTVTESDLWIRVTSPAELPGTAFIRVDQAGARRLLQSPGGESESAEELSSEKKASLLDSIRSAATASTEQTLHKTSDPIQVELSSAPSEDSAVRFWLQIQTGDQNPVVIELHLDHAMVVSLQAAISVPGPSTRVVPQAPVNKIGMLMDVELAVTVRFGGRRMPLKDILDLSAGSVVELDQQVQEPVDLLLDGKVIARGEVVVVDGNYGLRVAEVLSNASR